MKKYIAAFLLTAAFCGSILWGQGTTPSPTPALYRGNLAAAPTNVASGVPVRTGTSSNLTTQQKVQALRNLGVTDQTSGYGIVTTTGTDTPVTGTVLVTATSAKVYLTPTTGLVIKSGTVTTF